MTTTMISEKVEKMSEENQKAPLLVKIANSDLSRVAIIGGAGVDPDGLACVEAMAAIILKFNPNAIVDKFHNGKFDRPQNKTMRELLRLDHKNTSKYEDGFYSCMISVDGPADVCPSQPDFIIDHHPHRGDPKVGEDIRMIGSCSAIMWEYCMEAGIDFTDECGAKLATALAIGICTDTKEKTTETTSDLDFEAEAFCGMHRDAKLYNGIKNYPKPHYYGDMYTYGWDKKNPIENMCLVTQLGVIPEERTGVIPDLAEKYAEFAGVATCCVIAMVDGQFDVSVRTTDTTLNVDEFCKSLGKGGGRRGAGRFRVEMPSAFKDIKDEALLAEHFKSGYNILLHKILQFTGDGVRSKPKTD